MTPLTKAETARARAAVTGRASDRAEHERAVALEDYARRIAADAPPLSNERVKRIATIIANGKR